MGGKSEWFDIWKGWMVGKSEGVESQLEWLDSEKVRMVAQLDNCNSWTGQIAGYGKSERSEWSDSQIVGKLEWSDSLIGIVRMIRFRYANWHAHQFRHAFLVGFHTIQIFIFLTVSAQQKAVKFSYSRHLIIYK
jgi:hypothetical protein